MHEEQQPLLDWNNQFITVPEPPKKPDANTNLCIAVYGPGPDGQTCKHCALLAGIARSKTVYKCRLRKNTHGAKTDHRLRWPACAKFELRAEGKDIPLYDGR